MNPLIASKLRKRAELRKRRKAALAKAAQKDLQVFYQIIRVPQPDALPATGQMILGSIPAMPPMVLPNTDDVAGR